MPSRTSTFPANAAAAQKIHDQFAGLSKGQSQHNTEKLNQKRLRSMNNEHQRILQRHYHARDQHQSSTNWKFLVGADYSRLNRMLTNLGANYEKKMTYTSGQLSPTRATRFSSESSRDSQYSFPQHYSPPTTQTDTLPPREQTSERHLILNHNQNTATEQWAVNDENSDRDEVHPLVGESSVPEENHVRRRRGKRSTQSKDPVELDENNQPLPPMGLDFLPPSSAPDINGSFDSEVDSAQNSPVASKQSQNKKRRRKRQHRNRDAAGTPPADGATLGGTDPVPNSDIKSESHVTELKRSSEAPLDDSPQMRISVSETNDRKKIRRKQRKNNARVIAPNPPLQKHSVSPPKPKLLPKRSKNVTRLPKLKSMMSDSGFYENIESLTSNSLHDNSQEKLIEYNLDILPALENAKRKKMQIKSRNYTEFKPRAAKSFTPYRYYTNFAQAVKYSEEEGALMIALKSMTV